MIYITGDIHQNYDIWKFDNVEFKKDDILIICGDFGWIWTHDTLTRAVQYERKYLKSFIRKLNCYVLFADGNHENFDRLNDTYTFPVSKKWGGNVQKICDKCYHLMRGESYNINGKTFLVLGGAESHDKFRRIPKMSWWEQETISDDDLKNVLSHTNNIDCVITHCCPTSLLVELYKARIIDDFCGNPSTNQLQILQERLDKNEKPYKWFFGHYHSDREFLVNNNRYYLLYDRIYCLDTDTYL